MELGGKIRQVLLSRKVTKTAVRVEGEGGGGLTEESSLRDYQYQIVISSTFFQLLLIFFDCSIVHPTSKKQGKNTFFGLEDRSQRRLRNEKR